MTQLPASQAYARWARSYDTDNVLSTLDDLVMSFLTPPLQDHVLLDAGCGTARRLVFPEGSAPGRAIGVDLVFEMLAEGRGKAGRPRTTGCADVVALPFRSGFFDTVWCRLVTGHLTSLAPVYRELARVTKAGGFVLVSDFHPAAVYAGHTRTFRDEHGVQTVAHTVHEPEAHEAAAQEASLHFHARMDLSAGDEVRPFYEKAGAVDRYEKERGLPLLLAFRFLK